jgi:4-hydroxy-tetrahydrodipicolinate synthase
MGAIGGIWAAVLTPVTKELQPDADRAVPYYGDLLKSGCDGINVMGTTGEAMSFSASRRVRYLERLAALGLPPRRMMAGTGAASLDDAVRVTRAALDCGFAAALVMPPFFYRETPDQGIRAFFAALIARSNAPPRSIMLYNFPRMSGIALHADLVERLVLESNGRIFGMKESSNGAQLQTEVAARLPGFAIFPGSESDLLGAKARGAAGCVSGSVALWPALAKSVFENGDIAQSEELGRRRAMLDGIPLVPAMRYLTAIQRQDPQWERAMPPQEPLSAEETARLQRRAAAMSP